MTTAPAKSAQALTQPSIDTNRRLRDATAGARCGGQSAGVFEASAWSDDDALERRVREEVVRRHAALPLRFKLGGHQAAIGTADDLEHLADRLAHVRVPAYLIGGARRRRLALLLDKGEVVLHAHSHPLREVVERKGRDGKGAKAAASRLHLVDDLAIRGEEHHRVPLDKRRPFQAVPRLHVRDAHVPQQLCLHALGRRWLLGIHPSFERGEDDVLGLGDEKVVAQQLGELVRRQLHQRWGLDDLVELGQGDALRFGLERAHRETVGQVPSVEAVGGRETFGDGSLDCYLQRFEIEPARNLEKRRQEILVHLYGLLVYEMEGRCERVGGCIREIDGGPT
mmetsp:Transcript_12301/g.21078  ORF Transcript_12301/g.21078 Transcript_12301/m.21078 type:complete len:339 (-) Transcript_12301:191-1207(-)